MRFDDTNPTKEKSEFVESIKADNQMAWCRLGRQTVFCIWLFPGQMYEAAVKLIQKGKPMYVTWQQNQIREYRGTLTEPGKESPYRNRSVERTCSFLKNEKQRQICRRRESASCQDRYGISEHEYARPGYLCVAHMTHHRTGDTWCIYPMYDFAIPSRMRLRESHIPSVLWSLRITDHCMTGL